MSHLTVERLAALADDEPTAAEAEHLAACEHCLSERQAHATLLAAARRERDREAEPLTNWAALSSRLGDEGLIAPTAATSPDRLAGGRTPSWWLRAAAGVLLTAGGAAVGRYTAPSAPTAPGPAAAVASDAGGVTRDGAAASEAAPQFSSPSEALAALTRAEQQYQLAAAYLAGRDSAAGSESSEVYRTRLAALDDVMAATRQALYEAPHDPVINKYYLATVGAREATMQQLNAVLPVDMRVQRY